MTAGALWRSACDIGVRGRVQPSVVNRACGDLRVAYDLTAASALILPLAPVPPGLAALHRTHVRSAAMGVPVHVTAIVPFLPAVRITSAEEAKLAGIAARTARFSATFSRLGRFPGSAHLLPDDAAPFVDLITALMQTFPDCAPYEGRFDGIVPHATVAEGTLPDEKTVNAILPWRVCIETLWLMQRTGQAWYRTAEFRFR